MCDAFGVDDCITQLAYQSVGQHQEAVSRARHRSSRLIWLLPIVSSDSALSSSWSFPCSRHSPLLQGLDG